MSLIRNSSGNNSQVSNTSWTLKCTDLPQFDALEAAAAEFDDVKKFHLRNLCNDTVRCAGLTATHISPGYGYNSNQQQQQQQQQAQQHYQHHHDHRKVILDYSRQRVTGEIAELLYDLADSMSLTDRIRALRTGSCVNATENRPALHHLLRSPNHNEENNNAKEHSDVSKSWRSTSLSASASASTAAAISSSSARILPPSTEMKATKRILKDILSMRERIRLFSSKVRDGTIVGVTGQPIKNVIVVASSSIPILSSVERALRLSDVKAQEASDGRRMYVLNNIDPALLADCTTQLLPQETMIVVISKTLTESDVLLNSRSLRQWLTATLKKSEVEVMAHHFCVVTCNSSRGEKLGVLKDRVFNICEWIVPRFSTCSAIGLLPLSLIFGWNVCIQLLRGCHDMDEHFFSSPMRDNIPVIMGLLSFWNTTFLEYPVRAVIPYSDALRAFPEFVQQVEMESNGKRVALDGTKLLHKSAEVVMGGAGTTAQNVFFQLFHQGRVIPVDFIGFMETSFDVELPGETVSNHDELMSNFFAQPDALAYGKTLMDLIQEGAPEPLREHMIFPGNRPSSSILMTKLDAFALGQLLALYEHRTAVQGFLWGLNSFDQFGLELGRTGVKKVRAQISVSRKTGASVQGFNYSTSSLLEQYLSHGKHQHQVLNDPK